MQKLIVEITGPAGVGKSFLSKSLCSNLEVVDHKNKTITFKTIQKSFSIIPFIFLLSKDRFNIYTRFLINLAKWEAIERPNSGIFLIDQGKL